MSRTGQLSPILEENSNGEQNQTAETSQRKSEKPKESSSENDSFEEHERSFMEEEKIQKQIEGKNTQPIVNSEPKADPSDSNSDDSFERNERSFIEEEEKQKTIVVPASPSSHVQDCCTEDHLKFATEKSIQHLREMIASWSIPSTNEENSASVTRNFDGNVPVSRLIDISNSPESVNTSERRYPEVGNRPSISGTETRDLQLDIASFDGKIVECYDKYAKEGAQFAQTLKHFSVLNVTFSDFVGKYERTKVEINKHQEKELMYKETMKELQDKLALENQRFLDLKSRVNQQIDEANQRYKDIVEFYNDRSATRQSTIVNLEAKVVALEAALEAKNQEYEETANLFDKLTGRK